MDPTSNTPRELHEIKSGVLVNETNMYPKFRRLALVLCVLLTIFIITFLMYQNGKSIYDHGI